ncbi:MAG: putative S-layer protein [archaeon]
MNKLLMAILAVFVLCLAGVAAADFSLDLNTASGNPGESVAYTLEANNEYTADLSFTCSSTDLTYSSYTISAPAISDINNIAAGDTGTANFNVAIPATGIAAGTYTGTITCTESVDSTQEQKTIQVTVNSVTSFDVTPTTLDYTILPNENKDDTVTVTNTGSTTLTNIHVDFESDNNDDPTAPQDGPFVMEDNDGDAITLTVTNIPTSLVPGASAAININANVDDDIDYGEDYQGIITVTANSGALTRDIELDVNLDAQICDEGEQGNMIDITIDEPDSGDNFKPGETINVQFDVENTDNDDDIDVEIEIILWDSTNGEEVEKVSGDDTNINEDDTESFDIDFELPTDLDEDNTYYLYIKVNEEGNGDDECQYESIKIDLERDDNDVVITSVTVSPTSNLEGGDSYTISVEVENIGLDDQEDVFIEIVESDLEISESTAGFDLGDYNDNDNYYKTTFNLELPEDLDAGTYYIDVKVFESDGSLLDSELISIDVDASSESSTTTTTTTGSTISEPLTEGVDIELILDNDFNVEGKTELTIPVIIKNNGDESTEITLRVDDVDWADIEGTEYLSTIKAGQSLHAYVYLSLESDITGVHDLVIEVEDGTGSSITEVISLDFGAEKDTTTLNLSNSLWYWIIGIVILVVILVILVRLLSK